MKVSRPCSHIQTRHYEVCTAFFCPNCNNSKHFFAAFKREKYLFLLVTNLLLKIKNYTDKRQKNKGEPLLDCSPLCQNLWLNWKRRLITVPPSRAHLYSTEPSGCADRHVWSNTCANTKGTLKGRACLCGVDTTSRGLIRAPQTAAGELVCGPPLPTHQNQTLVIPQINRDGGQDLSVITITMDAGRREANVEVKKTKGRDE